MRFLTGVESMADTVNSTKRSRIMSRVRSRHTTPELTVRRALHGAGYRFRLHRKDLPGNPDIVLPKYDTVVLVNGCFWHGHDCHRGSRVPSTNTEYWQTKVQRNRDRDSVVRKSLVEAGWRVVTIWECDLEAGIRQVLAILESKTFIRCAT